MAHETVVGDEKRTGFFPMDRRSFIKATGLVGATIVAGATAPISVFAASTPADVVLGTDAQFPDGDGYKRGAAKVLYQIGDGSRLTESTVASVERTGKSMNAWVEEAGPGSSTEQTYAWAFLEEEFTVVSADESETSRPATLNVSGSGNGGVYMDKGQSGFARVNFFLVLRDRTDGTIQRERNTLYLNRPGDIGSLNDLIGGDEMTVDLEAGHTYLATARLEARVRSDPSKRTGVIGARCTMKDVALGIEF